MGPWPTLVLTCPTGRLDEAETWLLEQLAEAGDQGFCGTRVETGPGDHGARLTLAFIDVSHRDRVAAYLEAALGGGGPLWVCGRGSEPDTDWVGQVTASLEPVPLGRRHAALPGEAPALVGRRGIRVPRARAFGTGEHPSTRLAAAMVEEEVEAGRPFLDLGAGTGLLAALAAACGASPAVALEVDPVAAAVAGRTAQCNRLPAMLVVAGELECLGPGVRFPVLAANLERDLLLDLLPVLTTRVPPGGRIILSGLLGGQVDDLAAAGRGLGLVELARRQEAGWEALVLSPRPASRPRALIPEASPAGQQARLPAAEAHHLLRVRRVEAGEIIEVVDGQGGCWRGRLETGGGPPRVVGLQREHPAVEPGLEVILLQGLLLQAGRMEAVIRQATELGVTAVVPLLTARTQSGAARRRPAAPARWMRVANEAVKQCGRLRAPELGPPLALRELLAAVSTAAGLDLFLDPAGQEAGMVLAGPPPRRVRLLVGPEGGLTGEERQALRAAGFRGLRLGPRILRAETAAVAGLAMILARWEQPGSRAGRS